MRWTAGIIVATLAAAAALLTRGRFSRGGQRHLIRFPESTDGSTSAASVSSDPDEVVAGTGSAGRRGRKDPAVPFHRRWIVARMAGRLCVPRAGRRPWACTAGVDHADRAGPALACPPQTDPLVCLHRLRARPAGGRVLHRGGCDVGALGELRDRAPGDRPGGRRHESDRGGDRDATGERHGGLHGARVGGGDHASGVPGRIGAGARFDRVRHSGGRRRLGKRPAPGPRARVGRGGGVRRPRDDRGRRLRSRFAPSRWWTGRTSPPS